MKKKMKKRLIKRDKHWMFFGVSAGTIAVTIAIHLNVYWGTCISYSACTNTYLFVGLIMFIIVIIMEKYGIEFKMKRKNAK